MERPLKRHSTKPTPRRFAAYDLETTRIKDGTPDPLYVTGYAENWRVSLPVIGKNKLLTLAQILENKFFTEENNRTRFVAWYGNKFDVYFIAHALINHAPDWIVKPYLTRSHALRGVRVQSVAQPNKIWYEFLDGAAMTGLLCKLADFVSTFAPDFPKLDLDFKTTEFDARNPQHVAYAERDSEALYHAIAEANRIVRELTGHDLQPTIGNLAIKFFISRIPEGTLVWQAPVEIRERLDDTVKRGGYVWIQRQYTGPVWKYDLNQAYAGAMRDCALPAGRCWSSDDFVPDKPGVYHVYLGRNAESPVPFYYRTIEKSLQAFTAGAYVETWLTSIEVEHLIKDGWIVEIIRGAFWEDSFQMQELVDELERLRYTDPKGPNGPLGTIVKYLGCNAYGKTLEKLQGIELVMAAECPKGYMNYDATDPNLEKVFFKFNTPYPRAYHRPQLGSFITAHVRILVREAALQASDAFIYADTDCVVFSRAVDFLDIDPKRYGAWKQESDGDTSIYVAKKVYWTKKGDVKKAKGLHVNRLGRQDFDDWMIGKLPVQVQTQRQNFVKYIGGFPMFRDRERTGTDVDLSEQAVLHQGVFYPITR